MLIGYGLIGSFRRLFNKLSGRNPLSGEELEELERSLIEADVPIELVDKLLSIAERNSMHKEAELRSVIEEWLGEAPHHPLLNFSLPRTPRPFVVMLMGVNGSGKTTSAGKLAFNLVKNGYRVVLVAGDTFRAAAAQQLQQWAQRAGARIVRHKEGADPAAVIYDAIESAKAQGDDAVIVDTAGRFHNKKHLMDELAKLSRVAGRVMPGAPHMSLLVLDAVTGQNALQQARHFAQAVKIDGIILAKVDSGARGGVLLGIKKELGVPVLFIGTGEKPDDLQPFCVKEFINRLLAHDH